GRVESERPIAMAFGRNLKHGIAGRQIGIVDHLRNPRRRGQIQLAPRLKRGPGSLAESDRDRGRTIRLIVHAPLGDGVLAPQLVALEVAAMPVTENPKVSESALLTLSKLWGAHEPSVILR